VWSKIGTRNGVSIYRPGERDGWEGGGGGGIPPLKGVLRIRRSVKALSRWCVCVGEGGGGGRGGGGVGG
jgi:hypothetical protein